MRAWAVKRQTEFYVIRNGHEWAFICLDETSGTFMAQGSFGTFAHVWAHRGSMTLKAFLGDLEYDYFFGKVAANQGKVFSPENSVRFIRDDLLERRQQAEITKDEARAAWDGLEQIEETDARAFLGDLCADEALFRVYGDSYYELARSERCSQCNGFWQKLWPVFLEQISKAVPVEITEVDTKDA